MNGNPGLKGPLIDNEGFPRADVDIVECRKLRHRHACLQTDYSRLMKDLENRLFGLHSVYKEIDPVPESAPAEHEEIKTEKVSTTEQSSDLQIDSSKPVRIPFVWIHDVMPGSPAE